MGSLRPRSFFPALAVVLFLLLTTLATFTSISYGDEGATWWSSRCKENLRKLVPAGNHGNVACKSQNVSGIKFKADRFQILRGRLSPPPPPKRNSPVNPRKKATPPPPPPKY
uniref:Uncharacterized protein n=1 Tax=Nelumbo nucifera TaxID=4432 RepID=A0A822YCY2_NELNU|nr:TPA_asm: hypothetical protein HUJ06_010835 [Nelumbo nucifera]